MQRLLVAPLAVLFEFKAYLDLLLILFGVMIHPLAHGAFEFNEIILAHS